MDTRCSKLCGMTKTCSTTIADHICFHLLFLQINWYFFSHINIVNEIIIKIIWYSEFYPSNPELCYFNKYSLKHKTGFAAPKSVFPRLGWVSCSLLFKLDLGVSVLMQHKAISSHLYVSDLIGFHFFSKTSEVRYKYKYKLNSGQCKSP